MVGDYMSDLAKSSYELLKTVKDLAYCKPQDTEKMTNEVWKKFSAYQKCGGSKSVETFMKKSSFSSL